MYVLCIDNEDGHTQGCSEPTVGVVYKATIVKGTERKRCGRCGSSLYYTLDRSTGRYMSSECLFEKLPDDFFALRKGDIKSIDVKIPCKIEILS